MFVFDDGELIDGEPVVVVRIVEIDQPRLRAANGAIGSILDRDAVNQQPMKRPVPCIERRAFKSGDFTESVVNCFGRQSRIQSHQRFAQAGRQDHLSVVSALGEQLSRRDLRPVLDCVAEALQQRERASSTTDSVKA